jgi:TP901 family phage tail tape measure protein
MALGSDIKAGAAFVELYLNKSKFVRGLKSISKDLKAFGGQMQKIGMQMVKVSALLAAPFAIAGRTYAKFSDEMATVRAVTGATADDFKALTERAKELGRTTSYTASQVAGGMKELGRAGFKPDQILASIDHVLNLARATDTELPRAAEIAAAALRGFNYSADESGRVADVLAATANKSAQTLEDLGESMKYVAPLASEAGAQIEDVAAGLAVLANNGIKGSMAGTAMARAYKNLAAGKGAGVLNDLKIATADAAGNLRPLSAILTELGQKTAQMGSARRLGIFEQLFGRGSAAAIKLASPTARIDDLRDALKASAGTAAKTAKQMDDTLGGSFRMMMSAIEGILIAMGEGLTPIFREWMDTVAEVAGMVTTLVKANQKLLVTAVKVIAVVGAVGAAIAAIGTAIIGAGAIAGSLYGIIMAVSTAVGFLGAALSAVASPIGLGVVGLAGILYATGAAGKAVNWLGKQFHSLHERVGRVVRGVVDALKAGKIELAVKIVWTAIKLEWLKGTKRLLEMWTDFEARFLGSMTPLLDALKNLWSFIQTAWSAVSKFAASVWSTAMDYVNGAVNAMVDHSDTEIRTIADIWHETAKAIINIWAGLRKGWIDTVDFFKQLWEKDQTRTHLQISRIEEARLRRHIRSEEKKLKPDSKRLSELRGRLQIEEQFQKGLQEESEKAKRQADRARQQQLAATDQSRRDMLEQLDLMKKEREERRKRGREGGLAGLDARIDAASAALEGAMIDAAEAGAEAAHARAHAREAALGEMGGAAGDLALAAAGAGDTMAGKSIGSFSAAQLQRMAGFGAKDPKKEEKKANKQLEEIANWLGLTVDELKKIERKAGIPVGK